MTLTQGTVEWCLPCAAVEGAGSQKGKSVGFANISVPVLLLAHRCPGEPFSGALG